MSQPPPPPRSSRSPKQPRAAQAVGCLSHQSGLISATGRQAEVNFTAWLRLEGSRCWDLGRKEGKGEAVHSTLETGQ